MSSRFFGTRITASARCSITDPRRSSCVVQTPYQAPNANAYAERFVRSIKHECLNRVIPIGERHFRRTIAEFVAQDHGERNHQGLENELIERAPAMEKQVGRIRRRQRLGGLLNYYCRAA